MAEGPAHRNVESLGERGSSIGEENSQETSVNDHSDSSSEICASNYSQPEEEQLEVRAKGVLARRREFLAANNWLQIKLMKSLSYKISFLLYQHSSFSFLSSFSEATRHFGGQNDKQGAYFDSAKRPTITIGRVSCRSNRIRHSGQLE